MGGGAGSRLFPLTKDRSKPAVPLAGKYRIVDIPISNCINSGLRQMYVLTQFNSTSLIRHIVAAYKFDIFPVPSSKSWPRSRRPAARHWYQGTADAVRQNLRDFLQRPYDYFVILSGDQLYRMDYRDVLRQHIEKKSDITIATIPVSREAAPDFGIMHTDPDRRIIRFEEKPKDRALLDELRIPAPLLAELGKDPGEELYQASMGIYIFNRDTLVRGAGQRLSSISASTSSRRAIEKLSVHCLHLPGILGGYRHHPRLFRCEPEPDQPRSRLLLF